MNVTLILRNLMGKFADNEDTLMKTNVSKAKAYLKSFSEPKDDFMRSFFQYKCTMYNFPLFKRLCIQVASIILYLPYCIKLKNEQYQFEKKFDAIFLTGGISINTIPKSLKKEFLNIKEVYYDGSMMIEKADIEFLKRNTTDCKLNYYFKLKLLMKLGMYSYLIKKYQPKAIISYAESSFTTSLISKYCEERGIENISIMHGERLFSLKLSFFRCSRYYAWDNHYVKLFKLLRCDINQFIIEKPKSLTLDIPKCENKYFITFYLQNESIAALERLKEVCTILQSERYTCSIRPHPRGKNIKDINRIFDGFDIQDSKKVSLVDSFAITEYVSSVFSTTIFEAWCNGKKVIIDDYSLPKYYSKLKELDYIMLKKKHMLLSEIINNIK